MAFTLDVPGEVTIGNTRSSGTALTQTVRDFCSLGVSCIQRQLVALSFTHFVLFLHVEFGTLVNYKEITARDDQEPVVTRIVLRLLRT